MYLPEKFKISDKDMALQVINKYPFATLISTTPEGPFVSHLPLVAESNEDKIHLIGHMAKANPHWKIMTLSEIYVVFHGPHKYITPLWHSRNDVPTWNYVVVHIKGSTQLIEKSEEVIACLKKLTQRMEPNGGWEFWLPEDLQSPQALTKAIVGFSIEVTDLKAKFKLSQNRSQEDRSGVVSGLSSLNDDMSQELLDFMR